MATHFSSSLFTLVFIEKDKKIDIINFSLDEDDIYKNVLAKELTEFTRLSILFNSENMDSRLYMDGLDSLPDRYINDDENDAVYISPSEDEVVLYNSNDSYYPLIPGYYRITVLYQGKYFYSLIQIVTKHISQQQWEQMKNDVDNELLGLAQDLIRRNMTLGTPLIKSIPPKLLYQFSIIQKRRHSVIAAITDLHTKANYRIRKQYHLVPSDRATLIDEVTIRFKLNHPENTETLKIPFRDFDYSLPENKWLIRIVNKVTSILTHFMSSVENTRKYISEELYKDEQFKYQLSTQAIIREKKKVLDQLEEYWKISRKFNNSIKLIKSSFWYNEVTDLNTFENVPHVLITDFRYRELYQLYRELLSEKYAIALDNAYSYQWKRTDKLYEIWGIIQIIKGLSGDHLKFEPLSGWIFDDNKLSSSHHYIIPMLPENTIIQFQKDDVKVNLTYDAVIPSRSVQTDKSLIPIYMSGLHNRPDVRIDFYKNDIYIGSIIIDFKYSQPDSIWSRNIDYSNRKNRSINQLLSYSQCKSKYLFGENDSLIYGTINPVLEVWAIYPINTERVSTSNKLDEDHNIRLISMSTGVDNHFLSSELEKAIEQLLKRYKRIVH